MNKLEKWYKYQEGFKFKHWAILLFVDPIVQIFFLFLRIITLNLIDFIRLEVRWAVWKIKNI